AYALVFVFGRQRMSGILDHRELVLGRDLEQRIQVAGMDVQVNWQYGLDRAVRTAVKLSDRFPHLGRIDVEGVRFDVHEYGSGTYLFDYMYAGAEGHRRSNHPVAGTDA